MSADTNSDKSRDAIVVAKPWRLLGRPASYW